jgi:hypothetical protein
LVYAIVKNFLSAVQTVFWTGAKPNSYILRTVGIQALFDVLVVLLNRELVQSADFREETFRTRLAGASTIDFADTFFEASGKGRTKIRNCILGRLGLWDLSSAAQVDHSDYQRLVGNRIEPPKPP